MVVLQECLNMFWGVTIDGGKRYSQTVEHPFHLSMAALEYNPIGCHDDKTKHVQVMIQHESAEFLLCTLTHSHLLQQPLDLDFSEGEEVTFFLNGSGIVHLTGSLTEGPFADDYDDGDVDSDTDAPKLQADDDDEEDLDWEPRSAGSKRKNIENSGKKNKKLKITDIGEEEEEEDDDDEYDSSFIDDSHIDGSDEEEEEEMNDEFDSEELDEENLEIVKKNGQIVSPKRKIPNMKGDADSQVANVKHKEKKQKSSQDVSLVQQRDEINEQSLQKNTAQTTGEKKKKKKKKRKKKNEDDDKQKQTVDPPENLAPSSPLPKKRVVAGGTIVEDIKVGHGPDAKPGKMVYVYYVGTLSKNNMRFDSCQGGKPFRFRLGQGEVIKGWDTGVIGMKVGGKRRITVPPSQGYGNSRQGTIPPGSTLVFDVELKAVS